MRYLLVPLLIFIAPPSWAERVVTDNKCGNQAAAQVVSLQGSLSYDSGSKGDWQPAQLNKVLCQGSRVELAPFSRATIMMPNGIVLRLDEGTVLTLKVLTEGKTTMLELRKGFVHFISRTPKHLQINTPIANAGPEGTEFAMCVDDNKASLWVYEGGVRFFNAKGSIHLDPEQGAQTLKGQAPQAKIDIKPQDAVNWALYYPPLLPYPDAATAIASDIRTAIQDYRQGRVDIALSRLDNLPVEQQTPYFHKVRGAIRLSAGRVELAQQDIHALQTNNPNDAEAFALQSVLALTQNRKDDAYNLANRAIAANPNSATAYSALSYAEQGRFQLDKAQAAANKAATLAPHDAMVIARKAELELSQGLTSESEATVQQALRLDPNLERTQTVTGFSHLLQMDTDEALQSFSKAVELDSTSPLARLGLGLAKIRDGNLAEGRQDIEIAAILDPNNSLIRSYLGKAYYEERRSGMVDEQFKLAKERDPKDPTPYFYDAINKQTTNRPVEALQDMQKAIELNGNRGVYRSKLMLDSDNAARSASLGRIYNDLGFQQRGLLEGWNSINQDSSNYSAHRLLADNYIALPRHEVSRLSELLKAQLLQPVNITPVQPQAAESNILILNGLGSSITSFNEYNPLFTRNRFALQASGFYGSRDTISDEVVHSGVWDKFSYSLGQFHYQTNGFRQNNDQKKDIYSFFAQAELSKDTNLQVELRRSEHEFGDINQGFYTDQFSKLTHGFQDSNIIRGGLHHAFTKNSDILMSVVHKEEKSAGLLDTQGEIINYTSNTVGTQYEIQQLYRHSLFDLAIGMNYLVNQKTEEQTLFTGSKDSIRFETNDESEHKAFYLYSNIKVMPNLQITLGFTQDFLSSTNNQINPFMLVKLRRNPSNPKFGITWMPTKKTTFRFAAFRSLKRGIIQNQTVEPTQVAGFNQFYDDIDGTIAERVGFGLDHKLNNHLFVGTEVSRRNLSVPFLGADQDGIPFSDQTTWHDENARAYLYWTPNDVVSVGMDYNYDNLKRNNSFFDTRNNSSNFFTYLETHRGKLFANFYHPSGFLSKLSVTFVNQAGSFSKDFGNTEQKDSSGFWLLDAELGYRFPKRYGLISFGVKNLLDERFNYQGIDVNYPSLPQGRFLYSRLTFSF